MFDGKPIANFKVMADTEAVIAKRTETKKLTDNDYYKVIAETEEKVNSQKTQSVLKGKKIV